METQKTPQIAKAMETELISLTHHKKLKWTRTINKGFKCQNFWEKTFQDIGRNFLEDPSSMGTDSQNWQVRAQRTFVQLREQQPAEPQKAFGNSAFHRGELLEYVQSFKN